MARLDRIAKRLPPKPYQYDHSQAVTEMLDSLLPRPVADYVLRHMLDAPYERLERLAMADLEAMTREEISAYAPEAVAFLEADTALNDVWRLIKRVEGYGRRWRDYVPALGDCQAAILTGAAYRLGCWLHGMPGVKYEERDQHRYFWVCSDAAVWEILFADTATFGQCETYLLSGAALVQRWQRGHTDDAEMLTVAGIGELEARLLAATL